MVRGSFIHKARFEWRLMGSKVAVPAILAIWGRRFQPSSRTRRGKGPQEGVSLVCPQGITRKPKGLEQHVQEERGGEQVREVVRGQRR